MVPRPLSRPHHLLGRLPSNGDLAWTRTAASERSQSHLTRHGARDDTSHKSCDISMQRARTQTSKARRSRCGTVSKERLRIGRRQGCAPPQVSSSADSAPAPQAEEITRLRAVLLHAESADGSPPRTPAAAGAQPPSRAVAFERAPAVGGTVPSFPAPHVCMSLYELSVTR